MEGGLEVHLDFGSGCRGIIAHQEVSCYACPVLEPEGSEEVRDGRAFVLNVQINIPETGLSESFWISCVSPQDATDMMNWSAHRQVDSLWHATMTVSPLSETKRMKNGYQSLFVSLLHYVTMSVSALNWKELDEIDHLRISLPGGVAMSDSLLSERLDVPSAGASVAMMVRVLVRSDGEHGLGGRNDVDAARGGCHER